MRKYETVIGLEVHVELSTASKIFCGCLAGFGDKPNTNCCPVCTGMPGALPVLNKRVVELAVSAGLALECDIIRNCNFDRKNYFYPDIPKAYQISQFYFPVARNGRIMIDTRKGEKIIRIHELHMEEDAGKLIHDSKKNRTFVDYNRAGVPLIEIVSEPDIRSSEEAVAYLEKLRRILIYLGVSDCRMQEGALRVDINLSVREKGAAELGIRTEMKNMNSFKAIARAIEAESRRQTEILEAGGIIERETRRWDDNRNESLRMRLKEDIQDYRYFPEPDMAPLELSEEWIDGLRSLLPELQEQKIIRYQKEYGLSEYDSRVITSSKAMADLFEETAKLCKLPKEAANWLMTEGMRMLRDEEIGLEEAGFSPDRLSRLILMVEQGVINRTIAKKVFEAMFLKGADPQEYVKQHGLGMVSDKGKLRSAAVKVMNENEKSVSDYRAGKTKALGYLVGLTMKEMKGKADPALINAILTELLKQ